MNRLMDGRSLDRVVDRIRAARRCSRWAPDDPERETRILAHICRVRSDPCWQPEDRVVRDRHPATGRRPGNRRRRVKPAA